MRAETRRSKGGMVPGLAEGEPRILGSVSRFACRGRGKGRGRGRDGVG